MTCTLGCPRAGDRCSFRGLRLAREVTSQAQATAHGRGEQAVVRGEKKAQIGCSHSWPGIGRGQLLTIRCLSFLPTSVTSQDVSESSRRSLGRLEEYPKPCQNSGSLKAPKHPPPQLGCLEIPPPIPVHIPPTSLQTTVSLQKTGTGVSPFSRRRGRS